VLLLARRKEKERKRDPSTRRDFSGTTGAVYRHINRK